MWYLLSSYFRIFVNPILDGKDYEELALKKMLMGSLRNSRKAINVMGGFLTKVRTPTRKPKIGGFVHIEIIGTSINAVICFKISSKFDGYLTCVFLP
jgi:hypothetical protein